MWYKYYTQYMITHTEHYMPLKLTVSYTAFERMSYGFPYIPCCLYQVQSYLRYSTPICMIFVTTDVMLVVPDETIASNRICCSIVYCIYLNCMEIFIRHSINGLSW